MKTWFLVVVAVATFIAICETSMRPSIVCRYIRMKKNDPVPVRLSGKFSWEVIVPGEKPKTHFSWNDVIAEDNTYTFSRNISGSRSKLKQAIHDRAIEEGVSGLVVGGELEFLEFEISEPNGIYVDQYGNELLDFYKKIIESEEEMSIASVHVFATTRGKNPLYQLIYKGPGVEFSTDVLRHYPRIVPDDDINCTIRVTKMIKGVGVTITKDLSEMPTNVITESKYGNPDINAGFSGDYTFLYPIWTNLKEEAATGIVLHSVDCDLDMKPNDDILVLPLGDSGVTNYLEMYRADFGGKPAGKRITMLVLARDFPLNQYCTDNLNRDRPGQKRLYLCWDMWR